MALEDHTRARLRAQDHEASQKLREKISEYLSETGREDHVSRVLSSPRVMFVLGMSAQAFCAQQVVVCAWDAEDLLCDLERWLPPPSDEPMVTFTV